MVQRKRDKGNNLDIADLVGWVEPTGRKALFDGGFHPPYQEAVALEQHHGVLPAVEPCPNSATKNAGASPNWRHQVDDASER
jgi:hypothetical protein